MMSMISLTALVMILLLVSSSHAAPVSVISSDPVADVKYYESWPDLVDISDIFTTSGTTISSTAQSDYYFLDIVKSFYTIDSTNNLFVLDLTMSTVPILNGSTAYEISYDFSTDLNNGTNLEFELDVTKSGRSYDLQLVTLRDGSGEFLDARLFNYTISGNSLRYQFSIPSGFPITAIVGQDSVVEHTAIAILFTGSPTDPSGSPAYADAISGLSDSDTIGNAEDTGGFLELSFSSIVTIILTPLALVSLKKFQRIQTRK